MEKHSYKWIQKSGASKPGHKGALHRALGISRGRKIPVRLLQRAAKAGGHLGHMARFALNVRRLRHRRTHHRYTR